MPGPYEEGAIERYLEVENGLPEEISMRFHGDRYVWEPGEKLMLSEAAAAHIFGYGLPDTAKDAADAGEGTNFTKEAAFLRLGWINSKPECNWASAMAKLKKIKFSPVEQVFEKARRKKAGVSDRSLVDAGDHGGGEDADADPAIFTPDHPADEDVA